MAKLTYPQERTLRALREKPWASAWDLNEAVPTLRALERRGLVQSRPAAGERRHFENDDLQWALTPSVSKC